MADPAEVVIHYSPEKWIEKTSKLASASSARFVTLNYTQKEFPLSTPSPTRENRTAPISKKQTYSSGPESSKFIVRPITESLDRLSNYKIGTRGNVELLEKNWYHDLTNVGQRLRLLRETFKVIQSVRKKRNMGERADFRLLHEYRASLTGSPLVLDDEHYITAKTDEEDDPNASSTAYISQVPTPSRRGRPRKKHTRGRKPGARRETSEAPVTRTRASRRVNEQVLLPLVKEQDPPFDPSLGLSQTQLHDQEQSQYKSQDQSQNQSLVQSHDQAQDLLHLVDGRRSEIPESSQAPPAVQHLAPLPDPQHNFQVLHLPPILPSQRMGGMVQYGYPGRPGAYGGAHMGVHVPLAQVPGFALANHLPPIAHLSSVGHLQPIEKDSGSLQMEDAPDSSLQHGPATKSTGTGSYTGQMSSGSPNFGNASLSAGTSVSNWPHNPQYGYAEGSNPKMAALGSSGPPGPPGAPGIRLPPLQWVTLPAMYSQVPKGWTTQYDQYNGAQKPEEKKDK